MATWKSENSMLTSVGVEILNKLKAGNGSITVTRIVAGSERVSESQLYKQKSVSGVLKQFSIENVNTTEEGSEITFNLTNALFTEPYEVHQLGVYVTHPDYVGEQLYHISQCDAGDFDTIPAFEDNVVTFGYSLYLTHGNSSSITIQTNPEGLVSLETFMSFANSVEMFKHQAEEDKLITVDDMGNLIASGKNSISGVAPLSITNAMEHRALSLSILGTTTQANPTVASPTAFVNTKVTDVRSSTSGKNLFNIQANPLKKSSDKYSTITTTSNSVTAVIPSGANTPYLGYITPVEVGKTYTISFTTVANSVVSYMELNNPITDITSNEYGTTLSAKKTYTATKPYLLICTHPTTVATGITYGLSKVMVELGSSASTFVPFAGKTVVFPTAIELNSIGNYRDSIEWDGSKWWKVQRVGEVIVDGTTNKMYSSVSTNGSTFVRLVVTVGNLSTYVTNAMPNTPTMATHGNSATHPNDTKEFYAYYNPNNDGVICAHFLHSAFGLTSSQTITEKTTAINNWLVSENSEGNPLKIRYVLNSPIVTEISITDILEMYPTLTNLDVSHLNSSPTLQLGYAIDTTDSTTMYILKSLARKSDVQTANTFAIATIEE